MPAGKGRPGEPGLSRRASGSPKKDGQDKLSEIFHALRKDADMACSGATPERILDNIRKQLDGKREKTRRTRRMMSTRPRTIRLILLVLGLAVFLGLLLTSKKKEPISKPLRPDRTGAGSSYAEFVARPSPKSQQYWTPNAYSSSISPLESRFHGEFFCALDGLDGFRPSPPVIVPVRSNQLWTAQSFSASDLKGHLAALCRDIQIGERKITVKRNTLVFSAEMNARQAAVLVKQLSAWGVVPVSRSGPLPDKFLYLSPGKMKTTLVITFLLRVQDGGTDLLSREERNLLFGQGDPAGLGR